MLVSLQRLERKYVFRAKGALSRQLAAASLRRDREPGLTARITAPIRNRPD